MPLYFCLHDREGGFINKDTLEKKNVKEFVREKAAGRLMRPTTIT